MSQHRGGGRVPDLGPRGEGWVALQVALGAAVVVAGIRGPVWPGGVRVAVRAVGVATVVGGAALAAVGARALGPALTPLPLPRGTASFRGDGIYGLVRHPIYGGLLLIALGGALASSPLALAPAGLLAVVLDGKRIREEAWLTDRYPEYRAYRKRVRRRFLPFVW